MSDNSGDDTVKSSSATSGVNEEQLQQMIQKVVMGITKEAIPRMVQKSIEGLVPTLLDKIAEEALKEAPDAATNAASDVAGDAKPTLKALQQQLLEMQRGIKERDEQIKTERQNALNMRLRSDVQTHFAKHLGADSPHLEPYVNHFMSQFADHEGRTARKVKNEYGEDTYVPVDKAIDEMFKGDLKHLVQQSRANALPNAGLVRGQPVNNNQQQRRPGVIENAMQQLATMNPDLAPVINPNGTPPQK